MSNATRILAALPALLLLALVARPARADLMPEREVKKIRKAFKTTKTAALYRTEVVVNAGGDPGPAIGPFGKKITFHWEWIPGEKPALRRAELEGMAGTHSYRRDYLFAGKGQLLFALRREPAAADPGKDVTERLYFYNGSVFRYLKGKTSTDEIGEEISMIAGEEEIGAETLLKIFNGLREVQ